MNFKRLGLVLSLVLISFLGLLGYTNIVAVTQGGTGATTASGARTNLGLAIGTNVAGLTGGYVPTANLGSGSASSSTYLRGDGTWATIASTVATVSSSTATLAATDTLAEVTTSATTITLASASAAATGQQVTVHCARATACLISLARAGSDTIDATTLRAGLVRPGGSVIVARASSSAWTSTTNTDPRDALASFEWRWDSSSGNLSNVASGFTQAGTASTSAINGVVYAQESRAGSTAETGWKHGTKFFLADARAAFYVDLYLLNPTANQHHFMGGMVSAWFSGARSSWTDKGMVIAYDAVTDSTWQVLVSNGTPSVHDTGATVASGHHRILVYRDGSVVRWVIYYSASDPTFSGVAPVVGSATPSAWPTTGTQLQAEFLGAAGASWTGTIGISITNFGEVQ